ncbi:hypothetical protein ACX80U_08715 [Arthrobacter sp. TmT3-37]
MPATSLTYVRSVILVSLILSVSSASHVLASGHLPAPGVMLLLAVLLLAPATLLARRALSVRPALLAMGGGQFLLHHVFALTSVPAVCQSSSTMPDHHAAFELACSTVAPTGMAGAVGTPAMVVLHATATVVLALAVARSDRAVTLLLAWLRPLLTLPSITSPVPATPRAVTDVPHPVAPLSVHASVPTLRGPPRPSPLPA